MSVVMRCLVTVCALAVPSAAPGECVTRSMRITFYTCAEGSPHCLTKRGNQPMPFRTVAGDWAMLGRWLYVEDLGGWVHASDTGSARRDWLDVFIGDVRMAQHARRLGVQHWNVRVCAAQAPSSGPDRATVESRVASVEPAAAYRRRRPPMATGNPIRDSGRVP